MITNIYNSAMKEKMDKLKDLSNSIEIKGELSVLWPEFYEASGFYFMRTRDGEKYANLDRDRMLEMHDYATYLEAGCSDCRINDFFEVENDDERLKLAFTIADMWAMKLSNLFPQEEFHIVIAEKDGNITMRFHKFRDDEPTWLEEDDLDGYESEAICVMIVGKKEKDD